MNYPELLKEVRQMITPMREDDLVESNLIDLPDAWDTSISQEEKIGVKIEQWTFFSKAFDGFREGEFSILCGPTGAGKTTLLANLAVNFVSQNIPVFVASVEIGPIDFVRKMNTIVTGHVGKIEDPKKFQEKYKEPFFCNYAHTLTRYDSRVHQLQLMCDLLWARKNKGTQVALIDNLNFMMEPVRGQDQITQMDRTVHEWIVFVRKLGIHAIMVMHPRKTDNDRVDSIYDIKGSSTSIQEAQNVILFNRAPKDCHMPFDYQEMPEMTREIKIAKCRYNGRAVGARILFGIDEKTELYRELKIL